MFMQPKTAFGQGASVVGEITGRRSSAVRIASGFVNGMQIETDQGWRPAEDILAGDLVHTVFAGLQPVRRVRQTTFLSDFGVSYPDGLILVPGGSIGNCSDLYLLPDQHVLIDHGLVEDYFGEPSVLIPAVGLRGYRMIHSVMPVDPVDVFSMIFDHEEIVFANTGVLAHCPAERSLNAVNGQGLPASCFPVLNADQTRQLVVGMKRFDQVDWQTPNQPVGGLHLV